MGRVLHGIKIDQRTRRLLACRAKSATSLIVPVQLEAMPMASNLVLLLKTFDKASAGNS